MADSLSPIPPREPDPNDPFTAMGGGVNVNGQWLPKDHPLAQPYLTGQDTPTAGAYGDNQRTSTPQQPANSADPFAAMGGGVQTAGGGWVPKDHPLAQGAAAGGNTGTPPNSYYNPASVAGGANTIPGQAQAASSYSGNPTGAPAATTSNQGTQDVVRNSLLAQATQKEGVDPNDPVFRQQADIHAAAGERSRRNAADQAAESSFAQGETSSGALDAQKRLINEQAAQGDASFESDLAYRELLNQRDEIKNALAGLGGMVESDQGRLLQQKLADLQAAISREGLAQSGALASQDLSLRSQLGMGGLNLDAIRTQQQNDQFNKSLGFNMADREAYYNNLALQSL